MNRKLRALLCALTLAYGQPGYTQADPEPIDEVVWTQRLGLPAAVPTREVLANLPQLRAALAQIRRAESQSQSLQSGSHEWNLRIGAQERSDNAASSRLIENEVALERSIRWGGKAQTDERLGQTGVLAARTAWADQWHEAVRSLLQLWYEWQRARSAVRVQQEQVALAQEQLSIATRRVRAGDVPRIDELMAQAERDRVQAQLQQLQGLQAELQAELRRRYPGLPMENASTAEGSTVPQLVLPGQQELWVQRILQANHEIELAEAELELARLRSERAAQERSADPLLGVRAARERGGAENVVGVYLGIALTGSYRQAQQQVALAELAAAEQKLQQTRQRVQAAAQRVVLRAQHTVGAWQRLAAVEQAMAHVARLGMKAYALGEMTLTEALQVRRSALDAALAAEAARWEALEAASRVLVDAHRLWAADDDSH
jgi:outer membrane protein TolC